MEEKEKSAEKVFTETATFSYTKDEYESAYKQAKEQALKARVNFRLLFEDQASLELQKWLSVISATGVILVFIAVIWKL